MFVYDAKLRFYFHKISKFIDIYIYAEEARRQGFIFLLYKSLIITMNKSPIKSGTPLLFYDHHLLIEINGECYYPMQAKKLFLEGT
jgi:hypothetical protein